MTKNESGFWRVRAGFMAAVCSPLIFAAGCARPSAGATDLANTATDVIGCSSFQNDFFDQLYKFPQEKKSFPNEVEMRSAFAASLAHGRLSHLSNTDQQRVADALTDLYKLLTVDTIRILGDENANAHAKFSDLAAIDIGDSSTPEKEALQARLHEQLSKIETLAQTSGAPPCAKAPATESPSMTVSSPAVGTLFSAWKSSHPRAVYGALKTMATAYQSCNITGAPIVDKTTPDIQGIRDLGLGSDGVGHRRLVTSASDVVRTNPYLENYRKPASSCFDVTKTPLIYDYGGRPVTSSGSFDLFHNSGSGTAALGTDCSGFVYMAFATSGLRIKKGTPLSASRIEGVTSTLFTNPQKNGLTCFDYIKFGAKNTLRPGDVVAKAGHVFMVKSVGPDPFGIASINSVDDCKIENMDVGRFDFTIIQDSSVKNGIGMHMHKAADYLKIPDSLLMAQGLLGHAVNACKAKFGVTSVATNDHVSIVRHSESSDCAQGNEIQMAHQSCVASCPSSPSSSPSLTTASNP